MEAARDPACLCAHTQAAAHNQSNSEEARKHSAEEYIKLHEQRTGVKVSTLVASHAYAHLRGVYRHRRHASVCCAALVALVLRQADLVTVCVHVCVCVCADVC